MTTPTSKHHTSPESRVRAKMLHRLKAHAQKAKPLNQIKLKMTGRQPDLEKMFWATVQK